MICGLITFACSNGMGPLTEGKPSVGQGGFLGSSEDQQKNEIPVLDQEEDEDAEEEIQAVIPAVISGSYLTFMCGPSSATEVGVDFGVACQLESENIEFTNPESHIYLLSKTDGQILELQYEQVSKQDSWHIEFSVNSYMQHQDWILALELEEKNLEISDIYMEELEMVLIGESQLTWIDKKVQSDVTDIYIPRIEEHKEKNTIDENELVVATQVSGETADGQVLPKLILEGYQVFRNTEYVNGSLRVLIVYDSAGLPEHIGELEFVKSQIAEFAINESLPISIEPMSTDTFLGAETSNAALIIWDDLGGGGASFTGVLVEKFKLAYDLGIPFMAIGADLSTYHLNNNMDVGGFATNQDWSNLIHLGLSPDQGNPFSNRRIIISPDASSHPIADGPYGLITEFTYSLAMDHPSQALGDAEVFAVDQFGNNQAAYFDLSPLSAPTFTLNGLLYLINEREIGEILFKNALSQLLSPLKEALD